MTACKVFKSAKKDQKSFRVTSKLLTSIYEKARKVKKKGLLILSIPACSEYKFVLECKITKEKL